MEINSKIIKTITGYSPKSEEVYKRAFVHKSCSFQSNERLEFLGDSVINMVVADLLYNRFPTKDEGFLTRIRTKVVNTKGLHLFGKLLKLDTYIKMDVKGMARGWNHNPKIVENTFEALVGALYTDRGFGACKKFLAKLMTKIDERELLEDTNYKDQLLKHCQAIYKTQPVYNQLSRSVGFDVSVTVLNRCICKGTGDTKKEAEQMCAKNALTFFGAKLETY